jgi:hypothetical protein
MATMTETESIGELRAAFKRMREAGRFIFGRAWDAAVETKLASRGLTIDTATTTDWIDAAESTTLVCEKCHGTGDYRWGAFDLIKKTSAHSGPCYQCSGSGVQDIDDMFRNRSHVLYSISRAV